MDRFDRIYALHRLLAGRRVPISEKDLETALECSRATVIRTIGTMRTFLNAPIEYDRERNGYHYAQGRERAGAQDIGQFGQRGLPGA